MIGWRGRIGYICPAVWRHGSEYDPILPDGVVMHVFTLGLERLIPEEFERIFSMYLSAAKRLAQDECNVIVPAGGPVFTRMGYDRAQQMSRDIKETTGIPTILNLEANLDALKWLSAKKLVIVSPYEDTRNEERKRLCEALGFDVVNMKGLGRQRPGAEIGKLPPYESYRLAKQAVLETPNCDAIWILCPGWELIRTIATLEYDTGKPVVTTATSVVWAALRAMQIKEPIKGYGKLMEMED